MVFERWNEISNDFPQSQNLPTITPDAGRRAPTIWWNANLSVSSDKCTVENSLRTINSRLHTHTHTIAATRRTHSRQQQKHKWSHTKNRKLFVRLHGGGRSYICSLNYGFFHKIEMCFFSFYPGNKKWIQYHQSAAKDNWDCRSHTRQRKLQCSKAAAVCMRECV